MNNSPAPTILDEVRDFITTYVSLPNEAYADILAVYVVHTYAVDFADHTPYLYITSAEKQSGKTRLLETLQAIVHTPRLSADLSAATMFRVIESKRPTLMIDEVDTLWSGARNDEMRNVLNSGYKHNGTVERVDPAYGDEDGIRTYSTFCPKILAGIYNGHVPDTVTDRAIQITLRRVAPGGVSKFRARDVEAVATELREKIGAWVAANADMLTDDPSRRPAEIDGLSDRASDMCEPLLYIAARVTGWNKRARAALLHALGDQEVKLSQQSEALLTIRDFMDAHELDVISSAQISEITGRSGKQIATWFRPFGIRTGAFVQIGTENVRGYHRGDFTDAWTRYLPATTDTTETTDEEGA